MSKNMSWPVGQSSMSYSTWVSTLRRVWPSMLTSRLPVVIVLSLVQVPGVGAVP